MKKKYAIFFAVLAAFMILFGFAGCDSGGGGGPSLSQAEEAGLGNDGTTVYTVADREQVYKQEDGAVYDPESSVAVKTHDTETGAKYSGAVEARSSIAAYGKLTFKLPVFDEDGDWSEVDQSFLEGVAADPSDVKWFYMSDFPVRTSPKSSYLEMAKGTDRVVYIYADKKAVIQGEIQRGYDFSATFLDLKLEKGWNSAIRQDVEDNKWKIVTRRIPDSYKWEIHETDENY
jgi:hypothetical protein